MRFLAPVYGWFTEGFDFPDLREAKALIDQLAVETDQASSWPFEHPPRARLSTIALSAGTSVMTMAPGWRTRKGLRVRAP